MAKILQESQVDLGRAYVFSPFVKKCIVKILNPGIFLGGTCELGAKDQGACHKGVERPPHW